MTSTAVAEAAGSRAREKQLEKETQHTRACDSRGDGSVAREEEASVIRAEETFEVS